jgi:hypothetical protein
MKAYSDEPLIMRKNKQWGSADRKSRATEARLVAAQLFRSGMSSASPFSARAFFVEIANRPQLGIQVLLYAYI